MVGATVMPTQKEVDLEITALTAPGYLKWKALPLPFLLRILLWTLRRSCIKFPTCLAQLKLKYLFQFRKASRLPPTEYMLPSHCTIREKYKHSGEKNYCFKIAWHMEQ